MKYIYVEIFEYVKVKVKTELVLRAKVYQHLFSALYKAFFFLSCNLQLQDVLKGV